MTQVFPNLWASDMADARRSASEFKHVITLSEEFEGRVAGATRMDMDDLEVLAKRIEKCRLDGQTLVHCSAGIDRTGLAVAAWLVHCRGIGHSRAIDLTRLHVSEHSFRIAGMRGQLRQVRQGLANAYDQKQVRAYYNGIWQDGKWHPVGDRFHRNLADKLLPGWTSEDDLLDNGLIIVRTDGDMIDLSIEAWCVRDLYDEARALVAKLRKQLRKEAPLSDIETDIHVDDTSDLKI